MSVCAARLKKSINYVIVHHSLAELIKKKTTSVFLQHTFNGIFTEMNLKSICINFILFIFLFTLVDKIISRLNVFFCIPGFVDLRGLQAVITQFCLLIRPSSPCVFDVRSLGGAPPWNWVLFVVLKQRLYCVAV